MKKLSLKICDLYVEDYNSPYADPEDEFSPIYAKSRIEDALSKWYIDETQFFVRAPQYA